MPKDSLTEHYPQGLQAEDNNIQALSVPVHNVATACAAALMLAYNPQEDLWPSWQLWKKSAWPTGYNEQEIECHALLMIWLK